MNEAQANEPVEISKPYLRPQIPAYVDLRIDANEGPLPDASLLAAMRALDGEVLRRYPDTAQVEAVLAARLGIAADCVLVTAGADDAIDRLCRVACGKGGGEVILPMPSFEMFERYTRLAGGRVRRVEWGPSGWPLDDVLDAVNVDTRMIVIVSPNNPTGEVATLEQLRAVATAHPELLVVLDHAYAEFADEDFTLAALDLPNVVVLRTMSKAWSLAGVRVGYAVGATARIAPLRAAGPPYAVTALSCALAAHAIEHAQAAMERSVAQVRSERTALVALLGELGLRTRASQANFVLADAPDPAAIDRGLQSMGIKVRIWPGHSDLGGSVRIGCPAHALEFERLARSLRSLLRPQALLLDMDGVIADEGESYREAIRATLAEYGVQIDRVRIAEMKAAGNANNDWVVTHRLLSEAGVNVAYETVVERFERHYQGADGVPGLHENEELLVPRALLESLQQRLPLAIVTGRPRPDAMRFLERFDLLDLFGAVVTIDDVDRGKPDPQPVQLALDRLGVTSAWMVGDTPDDLVAARAARVLPVGICAPSRSDAVSRDGLAQTGAYRVLDQLADLQEMLP
jgi:histidinol-phosphate aminotransferase